MASSSRADRHADPLVRPADHLPRRRFLITAGPTYEPIDSVRFIGNRSSGRMGLAIAEAAVAAGHAAHLLLGPNTVPAPAGVPHLRVTRFTTTTDLERLLDRFWPGSDEPADVLIMAAAVADYRPVSVEPLHTADEPGGVGAAPATAEFRPVRIPAAGTAEAAAFKLPRSRAGLRLALESTPDLLAACAGRRPPHSRVIGFALEEAATLVERATAKMQRKRVDAIVANPLETMDAAAIAGCLLWSNGRMERPEGEQIEKPAFAAWLVDRVLASMTAAPAP